MIKKISAIILASFLILGFDISTSAVLSDKDAYNEYIEMINSVEYIDDLPSYGFDIIVDQSFYYDFTNIEADSVFAAIHSESGRLVLFLAEDGKRIVYSYEDLYCNNMNPGVFKNSVSVSLPGTSFKDLNGDGLLDIILINSCVNENGTAFKIGDVLFQGDGYFYRDNYLSDCINRFGMNIDVSMVTSFVGDGQSAEFLYLASTVEELTKGGFSLIEGMTRMAEFENFGKVSVVCGTYFMARHYILMVYLTDAEGNILIHIQPMENFDNFSNIRRLSFEDVNGDGLLDISMEIIFNVLVFEDDEFKTTRITDYPVYLQQETGFVRMKAENSRLNLLETKDKP